MNNAMNAEINSVLSLDEAHPLAGEGITGGSDGTQAFTPRVTLRSYIRNYLVHSCLS